MLQRQLFHNNRHMLGAFGNSGNTQCVSNDFSDTLIDFLSNGFMDLHGNTQRPTNCCFSRSHKAVKVRINKRFHRALLIPEIIEYRKGGSPLQPGLQINKISQAVNKSPTHYPCDSARTFRVILFSIHSDEWKSFQCQHQTALRYKRRCCSLIPAESNSLPHAHTQATKTYYKHQDSRIKKAQELNTKTSANSDIQDLPKSYQDYQDNDCQGRLLASFQDDA
ncbi:hypothetical protein Tco_1505006 [Tanacetum coccineum]